MRTSLKLGVVAFTVAGVAGTGWFFVSNRKVAQAEVVPQKVDPRIDELKVSPKNFIAENEDSTDVKVQTLVTRARMMDAYELAKAKNFSAARTEFVEASYKHKGVSAMNPEFGTLPDQASYQAIVCLDASGKKEEAKMEYREFMTEHKLSPLIHACFRRLERLNGKNLPEDEALLQSGIEAQEKRIRFETSVCGPKCLEKVLPLLGKEAKSYEYLAKICKTTDQGTTLEGLKRGCEALGLKPVGLELNAEDFGKMSKPFVWLQTDHYVAVTEIQRGKARIYDPRFNYDEWRDLPKAGDAGFRALVLAFEVPTTDLVSDRKPSKKT